MEAIETIVRLKTTDLLTVAEFARYVGHPRITVYRWIARRKIAAVMLGSTIYIPTSELKPHYVVRKCSNCDHERHDNGVRTCACRELSDMEDGCQDWVWKWN